MSDLGPEGNGLSARAVQTVLERQVEVEAYNDPAAVADRERRRLYGGLPRLFDAIRSSFASSKRRVMELDALLDELTRTNARASVSAHELTDGVRILARTCPEWCTIAHAQHGDEELFRVVSRDPAAGARGETSTHQALSRRRDALNLFYHTHIIIIVIITPIVLARRVVPSPARPARPARRRPLGYTAAHPRARPDVIPTPLASRERPASRARTSVASRRAEITPESTARDVETTRHGSSAFD